MAKQKELNEEQENKFQKVELFCINEELDVYEVVNLMPDDVVVCEVEKEEIEYHKAKKSNELVKIIQTREFAGGFFVGFTVNSEGYSESMKLTIIGKK